MIDYWLNSYLFISNSYTTILFDEKYNITNSYIIIMQINVKENYLLIILIIYFNNLVPYH